MIKKSGFHVLQMVTLLSVFLAATAFSEEVRKIPKSIDLSEGGEHFSSWGFQSGIKSDENLGNLAQEQSSIGKDAVSFGFTSKSQEAKFFIIGVLYSESLAYFKSGKADLAAKRLESIEEEFIQLNVPSALYNYINKTRNFLESDHYSKEVLGEFLSLFQPFYEDYAKRVGNDKLILFRAGSWLVDMSLAASGGDKESIRRGAELDYFIKEMKKINAPKGVLDSLEEIAEITQKEEISDRDVEKVLKLAKRIQTILG